MPSPILDPHPTGQPEPAHGCCPMSILCPECWPDPAPCEECGPYCRVADRLILLMCDEAQ